MSADNWTHCPKCIENFLVEKSKLEQLINTQYGRISNKEFLDAFTSLKQLEDPKYTLREDYEIYMEDNYHLEISYTCLCTKCGYEFKYIKSIDSRVDNDYT